MVILLGSLLLSCSNDKKDKIIDPPVEEPGIWELRFITYTAAPELYMFDYVTACRIDLPDKSSKLDSINIKVGNTGFPLVYSTSENGFTAPLPNELIWTGGERIARFPI